MHNYRSRNIIHLISGSVLVFLIIITILQLSEYIYFGTETIWLYCIVCIIFSLLFILTNKNYYGLGFHFIVMIYTMLCQFGFVIANAIDPESSVFRSANSMMFMFSQYYTTAIRISIVFICTFALSSCRYCRTDKYDDKKKEPMRTITDSRFDLASFFVGMFVLILGSVLLAAAFSLTKGIAYGDKVKILGSLWWYTHLIVLLSFAFAMILLNCEMKHWKIALIPYSAIILLHFLMGNRGEVFYSLLCCVAIYFLKYNKIKLRYLLIGFFGLVMIIPLIRDYRQSLSLASYTSNIFTNAIETFSEIGFQIAPTTYTVELIRSGVGYRFGGTYLYGIIDFFTRKIPFIGGLAYENINNVKYMMPQKGLGFSQVAEAFYNFGLFGGMIFFFALSRILIHFEDIFKKKESSPYAKMFISLFVVEIINLTRNSSGTLMLYITYILLLMASVRIISSINWVRNRDKSRNITIETWENL